VGITADKTIFFFMLIPNILSQSNPPHIKTNQ